MRLLARLVGCRVEMHLVLMQTLHMTLAHGQDYLGVKGTNVLGQVWYGTADWFAINKWGFQKISNLVSTDASSKNIRNGVAAAIVLLQNLQSFVNNKEVMGCLAYAGERQAIQDLLSHEAFVSVLKQPRNNKLSQEQLSGYDAMLRFSHYQELAKLLQHIYCLDVYITAGKVGMEKGFIFPKAIDNRACLLSIDGFYHPLLKNAIPNALEITPAGNVIFLTGANMAGKST